MAFPTANGIPPQRLSTSPCSRLSPAALSASRHQLLSAYVHRPTHAFPGSLWYAVRRMNREAQRSTGYHSRRPLLASLDYLLWTAKSRLAFFVPVRLMGQLLAEPCLSRDRLSLARNWRLGVRKTVVADISPAANRPTRTDACGVAARLRQPLLTRVSTLH